MKFFNSYPNPPAQPAGASQSQGDEAAKMGEFQTVNYCKRYFLNVFYCALLLVGVFAGQTKAFALTSPPTAEYVEECSDSDDASAEEDCSDDTIVMEDDILKVVLGDSIQIIAEVWVFDTQPTLVLYENACASNTCEMEINNLISGAYYHVSVLTTDGYAFAKTVRKK